MATNASVPTAASTAVSMITMNQAARFAASGEGWVMPIVLMKAFAMSRMNFISVRRGIGEMVAGITDVLAFPGRLNRKGRACILFDKACRSGGGRIHLKVSEEDEEIRDVYCCCYP